MISYSHFESIVINELDIDISSNIDQKEAINSNKNQSLFIVAGPGSGKTTVMVLKILKFVFVDDVNPNEILTTTFTRKAANELHSRILRWGDDIKRHLLNVTTDDKIRVKLNRVDFNQIITGTIDSISEEILRIYREPGTNLPVVIEDFVANSVMMNSGLFKNDSYLNKDLQEYLGSINGFKELKSPSKMSEILIDIKNRLYYDQVNFHDLKNNETSSGAKKSLDIIISYIEELNKRNIIDFPMLESLFLKKLNSENLNLFLNEIKIILVDEYQDTNLLQEKIYFTLAKSAIANGGNITVVGDDDQSLYRFRGATVDLFTNFSKRVKEKLNIETKMVNLSINYRSSEHIIDLCNHFAELDNSYQTTRVKEKPKIKYPESIKNQEKITVPVLGMFRDNPGKLAQDLSILMKDLIDREEVKLKIKRVLRPNFTYNDEVINNKVITLKLDKKSGSASDITVLTYSPKEYSKGNQLFPHTLRKNLAKFKTPIDVFNPRGQDLQSLEPVAIFCGLILECIDPEAKFQKSIKKIPKIAKINMNKWRRKANEYIDLSPEPHKPTSLKDFVDKWKARVPQGYEEWPETTSLIELAYKLVTWIGALQEDVEGIVYLQTIAQTITQAGFFNEFSGNIHFDDEGILEKRSVLEAIWNIFIPIAAGGVKTDENLLDTLPNNRINIMSIHQSKGLEFPFVVVDVGSRFKKNNVQSSFLRFPKDSGKSSNLEDKIRPFSDLGISERDSRDKVFDDLTRLYFVAFSRAKDVLLLIGLTSAIDGYMVKDKHKKIPNVALGWKRDEVFIGFDEIFLI